MVSQMHTVYKMATVYFLLVGICLVCAATSRGQTIEEPTHSGVDPESANSVALSSSEKFIKNYPEFVKKKLAMSKVSAYLEKEQLNELQEDIEQFIKSRVASDLSEEQVLAIFDGTSLFIDNTLGSSSFRDFPNAWENLRWRIAAVLCAKSLTAEEKTRVREQVEYVRRFVKDYNALITDRPHQTNDNTLGRFESLCANPFLPYFKKPISKDKWHTFCRNLSLSKEYAANLQEGGQAPSVLGVVFCHLTAVDSPTKRRPRYVEVTQDDLLVRFWHPRSPHYLTCFAFDNLPPMSRTTVVLAKPQVLDIAISETIADLSNDKPVALTEKEAITLARKSGGDFVYAGQSNELVGVNGTQFAVINKNSIDDVFLIADKELQGLLNTKGKKRCSLKEHESRIAEFRGKIEEANVAHNNTGMIPKPPQGILLAVHDGKGRLAVLHVQAVCSANSSTARESGACVCVDLYKRPIPPWGLSEGGYMPNGDMASLRQRNGSRPVPAKE